MHPFLSEGYATHSIIFLSTESVTSPFTPESAESTAFLPSPSSKYAKTDPLPFSFFPRRLINDSFFESNMPSLFTIASPSSRDDDINSNSRLFSSLFSSSLFVLSFSFLRRKRSGDNSSYVSFSSGFSRLSSFTGSTIFFEMKPDKKSTITATTAMTSTRGRIMSERNEKTVFASVESRSMLPSVRRDAQ